MRDDDAVTLASALEWQRDYARRLGSPVSAHILDAVLETPEIQALLPDEVRFGSLPGLRVMAAVHRLAIDRLAPGVAVYLPTLGGTAPTDRGRSAFADEVRRALAAYPEILAEYLARVPQTNETARASLLRCALSRLDPAVPVALYEFGCSAGLNLMVDQLPGVPQLEAGPLPPIASRAGCDLRPIDCTTERGRALLSSYIWVDDVDRWTRLQEALALRQQVDVSIVESDAEAFVRGIELRTGACTVVWHSAMWVYLEAATRTGIWAAINALGDTARESAPLVHVSWERVEDGADNLFVLAMRRWDGGADHGQERVLATGLSHGTGVTLI